MTETIGNMKNLYHMVYTPEPINEKVKWQGRGGGNFLIIPQVFCNYFAILTVNNRCAFKETPTKMTNIGYSLTFMLWFGIKCSTQL
jgi:hypothetical protein